MTTKICMLVYVYVNNYFCETNVNLINTPHINKTYYTYRDFKVLVEALLQVQHRACRRRLEPLDTNNNEKPSAILGIPKCYFLGMCRFHILVTLQVPSTHLESICKDQYQAL